MGAFEAGRISFAAHFQAPSMRVTLAQMDRGDESLLRIKLEARVFYGSDLYIWTHGGWNESGRISAVWQGGQDPWAACDYWGSLSAVSGARPKFCMSCGVGLAPGGRYCGRCGTAIAAQATASPNGVRQRIVSAFAQPELAGPAIVDILTAHSLAGMEPSLRDPLCAKLTDTLANASPVAFIDGLTPTPGAPALNLATAQEIAAKVRSGGRLDTSDLAVCALLLTRAPLQIGYWGPLKTLLKYLDPTLFPRELGTALGRLSLADQRPAGECEDLSILRSIMNLPTQCTRAYMERRARRQLAQLAESDPSTYSRVASSMLAAWDSQVGPSSFLPAYVLFGNEPYLAPGSHAVRIPIDQTRRRDAHPEAWNQHGHILRELVANIRNSREAFTFAAQVLIELGDPPDVDDGNIALALTSADPAVNQLGFRRMLACTDVWNRLPDDAWLRFFSAADLPVVSAVVRELLGREPAWKVSNAAGLAIVDSDWPGDEDRLAILSRLYLAYSQALGRESFWDETARTRAIAVLALVDGFETARTFWQETFKRLRPDTLHAALQLAAADPRLTGESEGTLVRAIVDATGGGDLTGLAWSSLTSPVDRLQRIGWRLLSESPDPDGALDTIWSRLSRDVELDPARRETLAAALIALAPAEQAQRMLADLLAAEAWSMTIDRLAAMLRHHDSTGRTLWNLLGTPAPESVRRLLEVDPGFLSIIGEGLAADDLAPALASNQCDVLLAYLHAHPERAQSDPAFVARVATMPVPSLQREAIRQLEAAGQMATCWLQLAESALPIPLEAAMRYLRTIGDADERTAATLAAIDSAVRPVRDAGLAMLDSTDPLLDRDRIWDALTESDDPVVQARLAEEAVVGELRDSDRLAGFDRRILLARRVNRGAKERVKHRLGGGSPGAVELLGSPERLKALADMADSRKGRDRDWALQRLAMLVLAGVNVGGVDVRTTDEGAD